MKKSIFLLVLATLIIYACGGGSNSEDASSSSTTPPKSMIEEPKEDDGKGIGQVKEVSLNNPLKKDMVEKGKAVYEMKCAACHKLTDQRVVGPGWEGITDRRKPEWIMNMTVNVDEMLEEDTEARKLLKECLVRMPNQNLSVEDARDVLEFMYANDGQKVE